MSRLVYACRFEISNEEPNAADKIYQDWLINHYRDRRGIKDFVVDLSSTSASEGLPPSHTLSVVRYEDDKKQQAVQIRWSYPDDIDEGLHWLNDARIGYFENRISIEHTISVVSVDYNIAPARILFGSPKVIRDLCTRYPAYVSDMTVSATVYNVKKEGLDDLIALLISPQRKLPIVFLSPFSGGENNQLDAAQLAKNLAGVAIVVRTTDPEVTWDMAEVTGRQLSCFNGACRIYWPGFADKDNPRNHRLYLGSWIEQVGAPWAIRVIEREIFAVAAFRFVPDRRISEIIHKTEASERQKRVEAQKEASADTWETYALELDQEFEKSKARIIELESENANLKANQQILFTGDVVTGLKESEEGDEVSEISTVAKALSIAESKLLNLEILPSALTAASDCPFQRPADIYEALKDLNEIVSDWRDQRAKKGSGGDLLQHLRSRGWGKRSSLHISDTTKARHGKSYEFEHRGKKQYFEPHITLGAGDPNSCASIHFILDQDEEKMIIAHVGKHLPNTKT